MKNTGLAGEPTIYELAEYGRQDLSLDKSLFSREVAKLVTGVSASEYWRENDLETSLLSIEDIAELKWRDQLLKESEERFMRIFETANDGMMLLGKQSGRITHVNPVVEKILGYSRNESVGKKLQDIGIFLDIGDISIILNALNVNGILNYDDVEITTKSGQHVNVELYLIDRANLVQCNIRNINGHKLTVKTLAAQSQKLEQTNTALSALLHHREQDLRDMEKKFVTNIKKLVIPYVRELCKLNLGQKPSTYLDIINSHLQLAIDPFMQNLSAQYSVLTPREIQVSSLAKEGKTSKEIADLLNVALCSVNFHRRNIRKKLGLKGKKTNMHSFLSTMSE